MYWPAARRVLEQGGDGLEPQWPPLYAWFLASFRLFTEARWPVEVAQTLLIVGSAVLIRGALRRTQAPDLVADITAAGLLLYPTLAAFGHYFWPEALHLFWMAAAVWLVARRSDSLVPAAVLGSVLGLALLTKSLLGPFLPFLLIASLYRPHPVRRVATVLVGLMLTISPVLIHNAQEVGRPMIASSARFNIWVGLQDRSTRNFEDPVVGREFLSWRQSAPTFERREQILDTKIRRHLKERGLGTVLAEQARKQYTRLLAADSFLTDQLPGGGIHTLGGGYLGTPPAAAAILRALHHSAYAAVLTAGAFGLVFACRRRQSWMAMPALFLGYNMCIFLVLHVKTRYRLQMLPALLVFAAFAAVLVLDRHGDTLRPSAAEWVLGASAALALLALAF
jgi:hypothetical protein